MNGPRWWVLSIGLALWGCGGEDSPGQTLTPAATEGGGVKGPALDGHIHAYVLDASGEPIERASLTLGEGSGAKVVGETNAKGYLRIEDASLAGSVVLGATASGFVGTTYAGVRGSLVTFALAALDSAENTRVLAATIAEWDSLPAPAAGKYRAARGVGSAPISLATFDAFAPAPTDACFRDAATSKCTFDLEVHADSERLLAVIVEGDDAGTPADRSDDSLAVTGLAVADTPGSGTDVSLSVVGSEKTVEANVSVASATGLVGVIGVPGVSASGQVTIYPSFPGTTSKFLLPLAEGNRAGANLWAVAYGATATGDARSLAVTRGITAPSAASDPIALTVGDFLSPPSATLADRTLQIERASGAALHEIAVGGSHRLWILDDRSSFELPSSIQTGALDVIATDVDFDASSFELRELATTLKRRAQGSGN